ncbi:hypothetical protein [Methanooceanicella nereidis]|nr:hypothetical protein [Methanocella sp. CWC-04]
MIFMIASIDMNAIEPDIKPKPGVAAGVGAVETMTSEACVSTGGT